METVSIFKIILVNNLKSWDNDLETFLYSKIRLVLQL